MIGAAPVPKRGSEAATPSRRSIARRSKTPSRACSPACMWSSIEPSCAFISFSRSHAHLLGHEPAIAKISPAYAPWPMPDQTMQSDQTNLLLDNNQGGSVDPPSFSRNLHLAMAATYISAEDLHHMLRTHPDTRTSSGTAATRIAHHQPTSSNGRSLAGNPLTCTTTPYGRLQDLGVLILAFLPTQTQPHCIGGCERSTPLKKFPSRGVICVTAHDGRHNTPENNSD